MKHLEKQELDTLRHLMHDLPTMLNMGIDNVKFLEFNYTPGRRRDTTRPNWSHGEHYLSAGKNIDGIFFDIFGDKWLFYIKSGSGIQSLQLKIILDYNKQPNERRGPVINGEISFDRLDKRIVNDVREFYRYSPIYFDFLNEIGDLKLEETKKPLPETILRKPK